MKKFLINKCMNYIKRKSTYNKQKLQEIEYGLTSIYLTISKLIFVSLISIFLGIFKEMIIFTLIFNILRMPAFGLHATKSWICLISTTILFIGIPLLCIHFEFNRIFYSIVCSIGIILIYKNAPADTYKRPIVSKKRRDIYKILSTLIAIIFSFSSILIKDQFTSNCFMFALILENALISPIVYKIFKLPYNNYINFLNEHPEYIKQI